ncbi:MAG: quinone-dependent dihydroorotate dehydrogenase [Candidatus Uhrbacteria bacterium]|nr:quinone-dependent dihydroorotate dehydrogenase [Candidatus Uhrbacteria bacterium]
MEELIISTMFGTPIIRFCYKRVAKPIFFRQDPEDTHDRVLGMGKLFSRSRLIRKATEFKLSYQHPMLEQDILGIHFRNPVGLTAGFDKNAELTKIMPAVGFGFMQIGSITGEPCEGNPKPRLWRLPKSQGLVVYYGLKNDGSEAIAERLKNQKFEIPVSTSVAKTNSADTVELNAGINDYAKAFRLLANIGDMTTVNISCPNTHGGEPFADPVRLEVLLTELDKIETSKPTFIKIACDISTDELDALHAVADNHRVNGFILTNLTKQYDQPTIHRDEIEGINKGGVSGKPTYEASNNLISHLYKIAGDRYVIIGVGGIFNANDAYEKIVRGASLVQLATGMIFEGPQVIGEINKGLVELLRRDGFANISEAVGSKHRKL